MITLQEYLDFDRNYYNGKYPYQRFGQAFCNNFEINNSELFNANNEEASAMAFSYVTQ